MLGKKMYRELDSLFNLTDALLVNIYWPIYLAYQKSSTGEARIPPELADTVEDIIDESKRMAQKYK